MPHRCTNCGHTFPDGSKAMLSGCPECGGNKFQFHPGEIPDDLADDAPPEPETPDAPERGAGSSVAGAVGRAANTVRDIVGEESPPERATDATASDARAEPDAEPDAEDPAQASARRDVVDERDLPGGFTGAGTAAGTDEDDAASVEDGAAGEGRAGTDGERPGLATLREELNSQFESIRIVEPGQYELNLMELYDRQEYIIALQENGRYVIEVPDAWRHDDDDA